MEKKKKGVLALYLSEHRWLSWAHFRLDTTSSLMSWLAQTLPSLWREPRATWLTSMIIAFYFYCRTVCCRPAMMLEHVSLTPWLVCWVPIVFRCCIVAVSEELMFRKLAFSIGRGVCDQWRNVAMQFYVHSANLWHISGLLNVDTKKTWGTEFIAAPWAELSTIFYLENGTFVN